VLSSLNVLDLSRNSLTNINTLSSLSSLLSLYVSHNNLVTLNDVDFSKGRLSELDVSFNSLTQLPPLSYLTPYTTSFTLFASHNKLSSLSAEAVSALVSGSTLDISYNEFDTLPKGITSTGASILNIEGNKFSSIPSSITTLTHLFAGHNKISNVENIEGLTNLKLLDLRDNGITKIPDNFFNLLISCSTVYLDNNQLKSIPSTGASALVKISVSYNNLTSIASDFVEGFYSLKELYVDHNELKGLPDEWYSLKNLSASNNKINDVPGLASSFYGSVYPRITELDLSYNSISGLPKSFSSLNSLNSLSLSHNSLKKLPTSLSSLRSLDYLDISYNQLVKLPSLPCVFSLDASNNRIVKSDGTNFSSCLGLYYLDLSSNLISEINLKQNTFLGFVNLTDNCLDCNLVPIPPSTLFICDDTLNSTKCKSRSGTTDASVLGVSITFNVLLVISIFVSNCLMMVNKKEKK